MQENSNYHYISSIQNPHIKELVHLQKRKERDEQGLFLLEGQDEIDMAIKADYSIKEVFFHEGINEEKKIERIVKGKTSAIYKLSKEAYAKIAYREGTEGIIAVAVQRKHELNTWSANSSGLYIVIEGGEKPGNIGAILRTADAAGVSGVIICDPQSDLYNPNAIRASVGAVFTIPIAITTSIEAIHWLQTNHIKIVCTTPSAAIPYNSYNYLQATAIVAGSEALGLTKEWLERSSQNILIPMNGKVNSLNLSVSVAIVVYEAMRQRNYVSAF